MKLTAICALGLSAFVAACSGDTTSPIQITDADVQQAAVIAASDATTEDVSILTSSDMSMSGGAVADVVGPAPHMNLVAAPNTASYDWTFNNSSCTYSATTGRFTCAPLTAFGLTLTRDFAFNDVNGTAQSAYDAAATASANFHVNVTGVHSAIAGQDTVNRDRSLTVSGLAGKETARTWNGTGTRADGGYRTGDDATRTYHVNDNVAVSNVVVNLPRSSNPWPASGTITRHVSGTGSVAKNGVVKTFTVTKTVTITFNGTQHAVVTVDGVNYSLDLSTGVATKS
jgi:hypothetical protein